MYALLGVSNTDIFEFTQSMRRWVTEADLDAAPFRPTLLGFEEAWPEEIKGVVVVPTVALFLQHLPQLIRSKAVVFVFDTAVLLEYVKQMPILDLLEKRQSFMYRYKPLDGHEVVRLIVAARTERTHVEVSKQDVQVIPTLLGATKSSLLTPILNFLYSTKNTNQRTDYQRAIYGWMRADRPITALTEQLPEGKATNLLIEFLVNDEVGKNTVTAVREMVATRASGKQVNIDKLAKKYDLASFDLRYLQTTMQKSDPIPTKAKAGAEETDEQPAAD
jgi:hypothetical protein